MSRVYVPLAAVLLAVVPACARRAADAPPAVVIAPEPEPAVLYEGTAPPPRPVSLAAEPSDAKDALAVGVTFEQDGEWKARYPHGRSVAGNAPSSKLVLPVNRPVRFTCDAATSGTTFEVPAFGVALETNPRLETHRTVKPTRTGEFGIWSNRGRVGTVIVVSAADFDAWLHGIGPLGGTNPADESPASRGRQLFLKNHCARCHTATPDAKGPTLEGLYGTKVALEGGGTEIADEQYIIESIRRPRAKIVEGWEVGMPAYDETQISAEEMTVLVAYLKTLRPGDLNRKEERFPPVGAPTERPKEPPPK